jgi:hypothetical protein
MDVTIEKFLSVNDSQVFETMVRMLEEPQTMGRFAFDLIVPAIDISFEYFRILNLEKNIFGCAVFNFVSF